MSLGSVSGIASSVLLLLGKLVVGDAMAEYGGRSPNGISDWLDWVRGDVGGLGLPLCDAGFGLWHLLEVQYANAP